MIREIKFRAFHKKGRWMAPAGAVSWMARKMFTEARVSYPLEDVELMQYTGLKDKNGVEIYEGDLLRVPAKNSYEEKTFNCFEVFYHDNECIGGNNVGFCMNRMHTQGNSAGGADYRFLPAVVKDFEVIGNVFEHPEFLEKKK